MNTHIAMIAVVCAATIHSPAAPATAGVAVDRAFREHIAAVQSRDLARLKQTITSGPQLELILPDGRRTATRAAYLDFHRKFFASSNWQITFEVLSRAVTADTALVTTRSTYRERDGRSLQQSHSIVLFAFRREAGGWRLFHDQNTRQPS